MIYLEKAMACSMAEADAVRDAVLSSGAAFNTGVLRRFDVRYQHARRLIEAGEIGQPRVAIHYAPSSLLHGHIHSVDTLMFLLGDPRAVSVRGELRPRDIAIESNRLDEDPQAVYHIEFAGGIEGYTIPAGNHDHEVIGADGVILGTNNGADWSRRKPEQVGERWTYFREAPYPPVEPTSSTLSCLEDLVEAHETGRKALGHVEVAHHATEICLAVAESHRRGGTRVELPLDNRDLYVWHV
jgi:predicted dehydrogenase